jgi:hypothetical protein
MDTYSRQTKPDRAATSAVRRARFVAALAAAGLVVAAQPADVARAVANLPYSAVAVVWGRAHRGTCTTHSDLMITCASMPGGYANGGTTVGNVWLYDELGGTDRHRHEARHADQWAMLGRAFPVLYGAESARTGGDYHQNVFEQWAGLHDGGYLP